MRHVAKDGEDGDAAEDGSDRVADGDEESIAVDAVAEFVIAAKHDETAPRDGEREEHLASGFAPRHHLAHLVPRGRQEVFDAIHGTRHRTSAREGVMERK